MEDLDKSETWMKAEIALIRALEERAELIALLDRAIVALRHRDEANKSLVLEYTKRTWGVHPLHPRLPLPLCVRAAWALVRLTDRLFGRFGRGTISS
jgi:hypothetical protein